MASRHVCAVIALHQHLLVYPGMQSSDKVEDSYREFRGVRVDLRPLPTSTLPDDIIAAETSAPLASATLFCDVHSAVYDAPSSCTARLLQCGSGTDTGVFVRLDVKLRARQQLNSASLIITGADKVISVAALEVPLRVDTCESNGCVLGVGSQLLRDGDGKPIVTAVIPALIDGRVITVRLIASNMFLFGHTV